jgi:serine/threonine protein kinase
VNQNGPEVEGSSGSIPISAELTSGVGTALYIAPETVEARHLRVKHLEKIDIYSFGNSAPTLSARVVVFLRTSDFTAFFIEPSGIVLFEMFHKMNTAHERIQIIKDLRSAEIKFPLNWEDEPDGVKTRFVGGSVYQRYNSDLMSFLFFQRHRKNH